MEGFDEGCPIADFHKTQSQQRQLQNSRTAAGTSTSGESGDSLIEKVLAHTQIDKGVFLYKFLSFSPHLSLRPSFFYFQRRTRSALQAYPLPHLYHNRPNK